MQVSRAIKKGVKSYFEATSIHGFRYVIESKSLLFKLFWLTSLVVTFVICFFFIKQTLIEVHHSSILANTEDIGLDEVPFPAISIMVPKTINPTGFDTRLLNIVDACNPRATPENFKPLHRLKPLVRMFNSMIRNETKRTGRIPLDHSKQGNFEDFSWVGSQERRVFEKFCISRRGNGSGSTRNISMALNEIVDSHFMQNRSWVNHMLSQTLSPYSRNEVARKECQVLEPIKQNIMGKKTNNLTKIIVLEYLVLYSPLLYREANRITCSSK